MKNWGMPSPKGTNFVGLLQPIPRVVDTIVIVILNFFSFHNLHLLYYIYTSQSNE